jgi:hypothetical protein
MNGQGLTANQPPPMGPLTMDERELLLELISAVLPSAPTRDRFNEMVGLMLKIRGDFP